VATGPNICARIFFLKANDYAALWDQVRDGQNETCTITLGLTPVDYTGPEPTWINNPLSIDSAAVDFTREIAPKKAAASAKVHYTPSKPWAAGLFVAAALTWFSRIGMGFCLDRLMQQQVKAGSLRLSCSSVGCFCGFWLRPSRRRIHKMICEALARCFYWRF
jgi:hypothetical protein